MNTLCHLCLALGDPPHLQGQFLGDFAKGPIEALPYPEKVRRGIKAHRRVDAAGETHAFLKFAKTLLPPKEKRYGGILVDLYGDYLLFRSWDRLMDSSWEEVYPGLLSFLQTPPDPFPPDAKSYATFLLRRNLLPAYADPDALPEIFDRVGRRFRKPILLSPMLEALRQQEAKFIRDFPSYFTDMKTESERIRFQK